MNLRVGRAMDGVTGHVEDGEADDVVLEAGPLGLDRVVHREQEVWFVSEAKVERVFDVRRIRLDSGIRVVPLLDVRVAVEPFADPLADVLEPRPTVRAVDVEETERAGPGLLEVDRRRFAWSDSAVAVVLAPALTAWRAVEHLVLPVDGDRGCAPRAGQHSRTGNGFRAHVDRASAEQLREEPWCRTFRDDFDRVVWDERRSELDVLGLESAIVRLGIGESDGLGRRRTRGGKFLRAGERRGIGVRLQLPVGAVPRADVDDHRC